MKFAKKRVALHNDSFADTSMRDVYENGYQIIVGNKKPAADLASSIHALAVAERVVASAKTGKLFNV
ncbi:MAG: hypothetical protein HY471_01300 [Candidatus Sungbacteria bacterium]|nr:hypothetical protein [Candidatus Sungbacteria bacterium]